MEVEFQVLQTNSLVDVLNYICTQVSDNYITNKRLAILAPSGVAKELDTVLWQAGQESFIPHFCALNAKEYNTFKGIPILITDNVFIVNNFDELINIMDIGIDKNKVKVSKLIEVVYQDNKALDSSRKKYVFLQKSGLEIKTKKTSF